MACSVHFSVATLCRHVPRIGANQLCLRPFLVQSPTTISQGLTPLTGIQRSSIQSILSKYNADNLSLEDAKAINQAFKAEGIRPSWGMKVTIEAAGFDTGALKPQGGPEGAGGRIFSTL